MPVEHARTLFKLSEALAQDPRGELKSISLRDESERLIVSRDSEMKDIGSEKYFDDLVFIWWR
jgi:hypothetical protein